MLPEEKARIKIDKQLLDAGWNIVPRDEYIQNVPLAVKEAHHASADSYQKVLSYFRSDFTLGLTATPERSDDKNIIDIFKNTAHKLDIQTAVEIGELVPVRCIRIHTNIDLTKVRFNSVQYNIRDLESKIFVPERNMLIVDTFMEYVSTKRTVIFCAIVKHA